MYPIRLQIENFCTIAEADISFSDFSSALIVGKIRGNEKFSNGAGKSTIFSAIKYVLFNEVDFSSLDKAIRHGTDYCKITFEFRPTMNGEIYKIIRTRSKKAGPEIRFYKKVNEIWDDITQRRNIDTEKELEKIVKLNYKTFCNSVLFAQTDLNGLASLRPEKRKLALKEVLQLNIYSKYEAIAKKKASELANEIEKEKVILGTIGTPEDDILKFEKDLKETSEIILNKNNYLFSIRKSFDDENNTYVNLTKKFELLERQSLESIEKQRSIKNDIDKINEIIKEYERKVALVGEAGKLLVKSVKEISGNLNSLKELELRDKEIVKNEIDGFTQSTLNKKSEYNSQLSKLDELKIPLPTGTICKYCRQKIIDRDSCQVLIEVEIREREISIKEVKVELEKLNTKFNSIKEEYRNIELSESKLTQYKNEISSKEKELEMKRSMYSEYLELLKSNRQLLSEKTDQIKILKKNQFIENAEEYSNLKININNTKAKLTAIHNDIENTNKSIMSLSSIIAVLSHKIEERKKDSNKAGACIINISSLENKLIVHQKVVQAFGSAGIPALITHTILDDFQVETNYWLFKIRPGLQLQFSVIKDRVDGDKEDTLDINYILNGYDLEYEQLSGAQKFIVALALKLGLASVIKKRLGVEIGLLLIDEVDKSIDEGGLEAFVDAIKQLQQDFKILVITHNNDLKDKFSHAILVEQNEKFISTAKVVNTW